MKKWILFIFLLFWIIPINANDIYIAFVNGDVQIKDTNGSLISVKVNEKIPVNSMIKVGKNSRLSLSISGRIFQFRQNVEIDLNKTVLSSIENSSIVLPTSALMVRGLYEENFNQIMVESENDFKGLKNKDIKEYSKFNGWRIAIENAFVKLTLNSGRPTFQWEYIILDDNSFNAAAYPHGKFLIHSGALDIMDKQISKEFKNSTESEKNEYREYFIAGVLSHELAHYYNQHVFNQTKRIMKAKEANEHKESLFELKNIRYGQEDELDADSTGLVLLQRSGYDPIWLVKVLNLLNRLYQSSENQVIYFSSHPSPHERLSRIPSNQQEFHKWIFKIETAFSDIHLGKNLDSSLIVINENLDGVLKNNPELLKAKAICLHKQWLNTATLKELSLRTIIDMPLFKDFMLFSNRPASMSLATLVGDEKKYKEAKQAYEEAAKYSTEPAFLSNQSTLLSYSNDKKEREFSLILAKAVFNAQKTVQTESNLGLVIFQQGKYKDSLEHYRKIEINSILIKFLNDKSEESIKNDKPTMSEFLEKQIKMKLTYDSSYVYEDFTPLLNLILLESLLPNGNKMMGKKLALFYYYHLDSDSKWAKHITREYRIDTPDLEKSELSFSIKGVELGQQKNDVVKIFGEPWMNTDSVYYYLKDDIQLGFENNKLNTIYLRSQSSPKLNKNIGIGSDKSEIIKLLGNKYKYKNAYYIFTNKHNTAVKFYNNKAVEILLFR